MKEIAHSLWVEKYRAKNTKGVILTTKTRRLVNKIVESGTLPNLLFYSVKPGVGKTSLARAILADMEIDDYIYVNASENANMDFLRNDISDFAKTWSITGKPKVVILDDMGSTNHLFQEALKVFSEQYSKSCRFIMTTNNLSKIIEPLKSRFTLVDFNYENKDIKEELVPKIKKLLIGILKTEKVEYSDVGLDQLIDKSYPDVRNMVKSIQIEYLESGFVTENVVKFATVDSEFYNYILDRKYTSARRYVIENNLPIAEVYSKLFREFVPLVPKDKQPAVIITIGEYADKHTRSFDPEIPLACCLIQIIGNLQ